MTHCRSLAVVLIVALPLASAAGCDGDEETPQPEAPALSKQEFAAQADAICRSTEQDLRAAEEALEDELLASPSRGDERVEAEFVEEEVKPFFQRQVDEIRKLTPPPGEAGEIEAALSAAEQDIGGLHPDQRRIPSGFRELDRQLKSYGSKACVN